MSREQRRKSRITLSQAHLVSCAPVGLKLLVFEALQKLPEVFRSSQRDGSLYEDKDWFLDINVPGLFSTPIWHELEQVYNLLAGCGENMTLQFCQDQVRFRRCVQA